MRKDAKCTSTNEVSNLVTNEVNNLVINEVSNVITNEVSNLVINEVSNLVTNEVSNLVTNEVSNVITNEVTWFCISKCQLSSLSSFSLKGCLSAKSEKPCSIALSWHFIFLWFLPCFPCLNGGPEEKLIKVQGNLCKPYLIWAKKPVLISVQKRNQRFHKQENLLSCIFCSIYENKFI